MQYQHRFNGFVGNLVYRTPVKNAVQYIVVMLNQAKNICMVTYNKIDDTICFAVFSNITKVKIKAGQQVA